MKKNADIKMNFIMTISMIMTLFVSCEIDKDITDYYLITITPPQRTEHYGITRYSDPKFEVEGLKQYESDSVALAEQSARAKDGVTLYTEKFESLLKDNPTDDMEKMKLNAQIEAMQELLAQSYYLISFTHKESFDAAELFNFMKEHGIDSKETNKYIKDNELQVNIYPISGF